MAKPRSAREGKGLVTFFIGVCCAALHSAGTNHSTLFCHMIATSVYIQLGDHKQLLCQSSRTNYAALALANGISLQQAATAKVTKSLPSLAERGVATRD